MNSFNTKLIITSDCMDSSFIDMMLRYATCALILHAISEPRMGNSSFSSSNAHSHNNSDTGVRATMRRKISVQGSEEDVIFSSIKYIDGRLICTPWRQIMHFWKTAGIYWKSDCISRGISCVVCFITHFITTTQHWNPDPRPGSVLVENFINFRSRYTLEGYQSFIVSNIPTFWVYR